MASALELILVPYEVERDGTGPARAPEALADSGLARTLEEAGWRIHRTQVQSRLGEAAKAERVGDVAQATARAVADARARGRYPLVLAGGCLSSVGVVAGLQRAGSEPGIVWIDAHGDFNTPETSPSGYWDGMALAAVCGISLPEVQEAAELRPVHPGSVVHLAGRDFDPPEIEEIRRRHLTVIPPKQIGLEEARRQVARCATPPREIYLHVDLDGLDPSEAPAVNFPVPGGPTLDQLTSSLEGLGPPAAVTLAGMSFERINEAEAAKMVATCRRLLEAVLPLCS